MKKLLFGLIATFLIGIAGNAQQQTPKRIIGIDPGTIFVPTPTFPTPKDVERIGSELNTYYTFQNSTFKAGEKLYLQFDKVKIDGVDYILRVTHNNKDDIKTVSVSSVDMKKLEQQLQTAGAFNRECPLVYCARVSQTTIGYIGCMIHFISGHD